MMHQTPTSHELGAPGVLLPCRVCRRVLSGLFRILELFVLFCSSFHCCICMFNMANTAERASGKSFLS